MKYKVLKEFISNKSFKHYKVGDIYEISIAGKNTEALIENGFIEEIKEKVKLSGQYVEGGGHFYLLELDVLGPHPNKVQSLSGSLLRNAAASIGLSFETEDECRDFIKKMKAYQVIRRDAKGFEPDWEDKGQRKLIGGLRGQKLTWYCIYDWKDLGQIYFETEEDIEKSLKVHRQEWLTLLGGEE